MPKPLVGSIDCLHKKSRWTSVEFPDDHHIGSSSVKEQILPQIGFICAVKAPLFEYIDYTMPEEGLKILRRCY